MESERLFFSNIMTFHVSNHFWQKLQCRHSCPCTHFLAWDSTFKGRKVQTYSAWTFRSWRRLLEKSGNNYTMKRSYFTKKSRIFNYFAVRMSKGVLTVTCSLFTLLFPSAFSLHGCNWGETNKIMLHFI